ncbi:MAG: TolC family protein [Bacteroidota bacterium]
MLRRSLFLLIFFPITLFSQPILKLDEAIAIALEENYGLQIAALEQTASNMQVYKSNVGMGPVVDWNVNYSMTGNNVRQKFIDGREVNRFGRAFNPNTDVTARWTVYDGGRMQAAFDRLGLIGELTGLQGKIQIQNTVVDVMQAYYNIVRQQETVDFLNTIIKYYDERLKITEQRWTVGQGSKIDFLQSQTVLNTQLSDLAIAQNGLRNAKVVLNGLLNRPPNQDFITEKLENVRIDYDLATLTSQAETNNRDLLLLQKSLEISLKQEEELEAARKPQVDLNGSVGYVYSNTNAGFLLSNQNFLARVGFTARWNLYDGNNRKNQIAIAQVNTRIVEKQQANLEAQILTDLTLAYNQYRNDLELLTFEEQNKTIAEENLSISLEKFRLGGSTILELNEAQRTYDIALNRLVNAQFNLRISALDLLRLSGTLVE